MMAMERWPALTAPNRRAPTCCAYVQIAAVHGWLILDLEYMTEAGAGRNIAHKAIVERTEKITYERTKARAPRPTTAEAFAHLPIVETMRSSRSRCNGM